MSTLGSVALHRDLVQCYSMFWNFAVATSIDGGIGTLPVVLVRRTQVSNGQLSQCTLSIRCLDAASSLFYAICAAIAIELAAL